MKEQRMIAGVDETGRGPLAGPVVAAAVILPRGDCVAGVADSKTLTARKRAVLAAQIRACALAWALGEADNHEIDRLNILNASLLAMQRAVEALAVRPLEVLVDGIHCPRLSCRVRAIVKGDASVPQISAASILAKVHRDGVMAALDRQFPGYGFSRHKGYPTPQHLEALERLGASPVHRCSFAPVRRVVICENHLFTTKSTKCTKF